MGLLQQMPPPMSDERQTILALSFALVRMYRLMVEKRVLTAPEAAAALDEQAQSLMGLGREAGASFLTLMADEFRGRENG